MEDITAPARTVQHGTAAHWSRRYVEGKDYAPLTDQERELLAALPGPRTLGHWSCAAAPAP
ncbi:hypothetical protein [Peterkaempfera griseoplana]|uniref:hypothetical protein n=1 Tax=Peterkaempfera griseoplana TaxID=66896 RepID=UPI0006E35FC3|nr:hypothetical protein [Peterkaempfera griseoplana]